jgi:polyribonucleotide nucleotidyltransferase
LIHIHEFEVGGKTLTLESGRVAKQAGGAVLLGMGDTVILGVATMSENPRAGIDFLPLTCDYEERKYSVGKIPGGFIKRGGRPSEKAVLVSRLIDRPLRPLFPKGLRHDLQVIAMPFAVDQACPPDVLAITAAGAALAVSDIPFKYPVAGVRVGRIDGEFILFPSQAEIAAGDLDLVVAGHEFAISMVEAGASEITEDVMREALAFAHDAVKVIVREIASFAATAWMLDVSATEKSMPPLASAATSSTARSKSAAWSRRLIRRDSSGRRLRASCITSIMPRVARCIGWVLRITSKYSRGDFAPSRSSSSLWILLR